MNQLTGHFDLEEFTASQVAERSNEPIEAPLGVRINLRALCAQVLEPARTLLARPIIITSGYRPIWLNALIGGAVNSAHVDGLAADFRVLGMDNITAAQTIAASDIPFDQLILEFSWIHISLGALSLPAGKPRREVLTAYKYRHDTRYRNGLVVIV